MQKCEYLVKGFVILRPELYLVIGESLTVIDKGKHGLNAIMRVSGRSSYWKVFFPLKPEMVLLAIQFLEANIVPSSRLL